MSAAITVAAIADMDKWIWPIPTPRSTIPGQPMGPLQTGSMTGQIVGTYNNAAGTGEAKARGMAGRITDAQRANERNAPKKVAGSTQARPEARKHKSLAHNNKARRISLIRTYRGQSL